MTTAARQPQPKMSAPLRFAVVGGGVVLAAGLSLSDVYAKEVNYDAVRADIAKEVEKGHGPLFMRLAWHSCGTFCKHAKDGGSFSGCAATMRFSPEADHGANAGLGEGRALLEPIYQKYPGLSYADLWVLAGAVAVEEMGGPKIGFTPGRADGGAKDCTPDGRLPDADGQSKAHPPAPADAAQHLRDIFYRMGFNDQEIVALSGAHAVGRCHEDRSGYWGPWTRAETTFSNEYFRELFENTWTLKKKHNGKAWTGPEQYEDPTGDLMMLPTDIVLTQDPSFKKYAEAYAKDEDKFFKDFSKAYQKLNELGAAAPKKGWFGGLF